MTGLGEEDLTLVFSKHEEHAIIEAHSHCAICECDFFAHNAVTDPEFPRGGGANPQGRGANLLFDQKCPENCMKMKEFGPGGGCRSLVSPLDPSM